MFHSPGILLFPQIVVSSLTMLPARNALCSLCLVNLNPSASSPEIAHLLRDVTGFFNLNLIYCYVCMHSIFFSEVLIFPNYIFIFFIYWYNAFSPHRLKLPYGEVPSPPPTNYWIPSTTEFLPAWSIVDFQ